MSVTSALLCRSWTRTGCTATAAGTALASQRGKCTSVSRQLGSCTLDPPFCEACLEWPTFALAHFVRTSLLGLFKQNHPLHFRPVAKHEATHPQQSLRRSLVCRA